MSINLESIEKRLKDPERRAILKLLQARKGLVLVDICKELELSQKTVSKHIDVLKELSLVKIDIRTLKYVLNQEQYSRAKVLFKSFFL